MLEVITGPMYGGKTDELIRRINRLKYAVPPPMVYVYKPVKDTRSMELQAHNGEIWPVDMLLEDSDPLGHDEDDWVFIDEFQFADMDWVAVLDDMNQRGVNMVVAGLALDSRGQRFGPMARLLAYADKITVLPAICVVCGADAGRTQRKRSGGGQVLVGGKDLYEARCIKCWEPR